MAPALLTESSEELAKVEVIVRALVDAGAHLNVADNRGVTPLYNVSQVGHVHLLHTLISLGAIIDYMDENHGRTALYGAALRGHLEAAKFLLSNGAKVDARDALLRRTPLMLACQEGCVEIMQ